jgi:alcohol dehydrogenase (NADP+)
MMKTFVLANGLHLPALGLGTWKSSAAALPDSIAAALDAQYAHLDCASIYDNEAQVGAVLQPLLDRGLLRREQLWVTSKLWNACHEPQLVRAACVETLQDLRLDYLDLYLMHWPIAFRTGLRYPNSVADILAPQQHSINATWSAMEQLVREGLVRSIGVSNFSVRFLEQLRASQSIAPQVNQVECHPYLQQNALLDYCRSNGIHLSAYAPLGSSDRPAELKHAGEQSVLADPIVANIAAKHRASVPQVLLAWHFARGCSAICKSDRPARLVQNSRAQDLVLDAGDLAAIAAIGHVQRYVNPQSWFAAGSPLTENLVWTNQ